MHGCSRRALAPLLCLAAGAGGPFAAGQTASSTGPAGRDFALRETGAPLPEPLRSALAGLGAPALAAHVAFLADPGLEGRGLGSRGLATAGEYVVSALVRAGVPSVGSKPEDRSARDSYFQPVPLREISGAGGSLSVETPSAGRPKRTFRSGVDCRLPSVRPWTISGPVVFAGFGIREAAAARDDYRGLEVRGAIVFVLGGLPPGPEWRTPDLAERYGSEERRERYAAKLATARSMGARAVVGVELRDFAKRAFEDDPPEPKYFLPTDDAGATEAAPLVLASPAVADAILGSSTRGHPPGDASPRALPGMTVTIRVTGRERAVTSRNVVGVLAGSDPELRQEAVVIGAHLDHLGKVRGTVHPGADDNASGVAALIEIAKAFAASPHRLKRSLVFAFWTGEEEGKLGSGFWVRHPLWPLPRTTAYLNLDMIGHPWSAGEIRKLVTDAGVPDFETFLNKVTPADFAEPGLPRDAPELAAALLRAGPGTGLAVHLDRTDGTSGGSDYRDFARAGVPWIRFFGNFFPGYHEAGDTPERLDPAQVLRIARFCLATAWLLADR